MDISLDDCKSFCGYLEKKSPKLMVGYQKRYFKILEGKTMVYLGKENDAQPKGVVQLDQIGRPVSVDDKVFKFTLEGRDFILRAKNSTTKDQWIRVLNVLLDEIEKKKRRSTPEKRSAIDNDDIIESRKRGSTVKSHKVQSLDKSTIDLLKSHGMTTNDDNTVSERLVKSKGIDALINVNDPKVKARIHYGFLYKIHKSRGNPQKRWFFIYSHRPLSNEQYDKDENDVNKTSGFIEFDVLYYFKYEKDDEKSPMKSGLDLALSHKIEPSDKDNKYYLTLDVDDRRYELYSESKAERDEWFECLKNSRRTAKEYKQSMSKHPRNVAILYNTYTSSREEFRNKIENELSQRIGNYNEIATYNELDFALNECEHLITSTLDGCVYTSSPKTDLLQSYAEIMNNNYLIIVQTYWDKAYTSISNNDIMNLALRLFNFSDKLRVFHIIDENFNKNARELVKIFMKKTYKNTLDIIKNVLKNEREVKAVTNSKGHYITNGPKDVFDVLNKTFALVRGYNNKYIYEQACVLFNECIIQYLIGVDCVISNKAIIVNDEFLIAIGNNSLELMMMLTKFVLECNGKGILNEKEINEALRFKQINSSVNLMSQNALSRFVDELSGELAALYDKVNFMDVNVKSTLTMINDIYGQFNKHMNEMVVKKTWEEILKLKVFYYVKSLIANAHKKVKDVNDLINKLKEDKEVIIETFESVVGENLTEVNVKILNDIIDFLEAGPSLISSPCVTLREQMGVSFTLSTAKTLVNLRSDFSKDEKKEAIALCKDVLDEYVDNNKGKHSRGFFDKMEEEIKADDNDNDNEEHKYKDVKEKQQLTSLNDYLQNEDDEDDEGYYDSHSSNSNKEDNKHDDVNIIAGGLEEVSDVVYEGTMKKKSHSSWQERFFQLKSGYLYWFKDKQATTSQNKISIANTVRIESHKKKKFMIEVNDDKKKRNGKVYKFECVSDEEKDMWISAITKEMKRLQKKEEENEEENYEISQKKKVIVDKYTELPEYKDRSYMKRETEKMMKNENYFQPIPKKEIFSKFFKSITGKDNSHAPSVNKTTNVTGTSVVSNQKSNASVSANTGNNKSSSNSTNTNESSSRSSNSNRRGVIAQFNIEDNPHDRRDDTPGCFGMLKSLLGCLFKVVRAYMFMNKNENYYHIFTELFLMGIGMSLSLVFEFISFKLRKSSIDEWRYRGV